MRKSKELRRYQKELRQAAKLAQLAKRYSQEQDRRGWFEAGEAFRIAKANMGSRRGRIQDDSLRTECRVLDRFLTEIDEYIPEGDIHRKDRKALCRYLQIVRGCAPPFGSGLVAQELNEIKDPSRPLRQRRVRRKKKGPHSLYNAQMEVYKELGLTMPFEHFFDPDEAFYLDDDEGIVPPNCEDFGGGDDYPQPNYATPAPNWKANQ